MTQVLGPNAAPEDANRKLLLMALAVLVVRNGGRIELSAQQLYDLPNGGLSYQFGNDGSLALTYVEDKRNEIKPGMELG